MPQVTETVSLLWVKYLNINFMYLEKIVSDEEMLIPFSSVSEL